MKGMFGRWMAAVAMVLALARCVQPPQKEPPADDRQAWRDSGKALAAAKAGDPAALHRSFAAARAQVMLPFINGGEDAEAISENLEEILRTLGDGRFAAALLKEEPQTRSAVRDCMSQQAVKAGSPKTSAVLCAAPLVRWPADEAADRSARESGTEPELKKGWGP